MTNQEINIAISKMCGWVNILTPHEDQYHFLTDMQLREAMGRVVGRNAEMYSDGLHHPIPNFCNDLNAMHEAENWLRTQGVLWVDYENRITKCATATQRAEAFLRTIGKWEE